MPGLLRSLAVSAFIRMPSEAEIATLIRAYLNDREWQKGLVANQEARKAARTRQVPLIRAFMNSSLGLLEFKRAIDRESKVELLHKPPHSP